MRCFFAIGRALSDHPENAQTCAIPMGWPLNTAGGWPLNTAGGDRWIRQVRLYHSKLNWTPKIKGPYYYILFHSVWSLLVSPCTYHTADLSHQVNMDTDHRYFHTLDPFYFRKGRKDTCYTPCPLYLCLGFYDSVISSETKRCLLVITKLIYIYIYIYIYIHT